MYRFRKFLCVLLAVVFCLACGVWVKSANLVRLASIEGERTYFLDSASSLGLQKNSLSPFDIMRVKGECVHTTLSAYTGGRYAVKKDFAEKIAENFHAKILFFEEVNGTISYYAYTNEWADSVCLYGQKINLHIAIGDERLTVGTPIIFGGY